MLVTVVGEPDLGPATELTCTQLLSLPCRRDATWDKTSTVLRTGIFESVRGDFGLLAIAGPYSDWAEFGKEIVVFPSFA